MRYIVDNLKIDTNKLVAVMALHLLSVPLPQTYLSFIILVTQLERKTKFIPSKYISSYVI